MLFSCSRSPILDRRLLHKRSDSRKPNNHTNGLALAGNSLSLSFSLSTISLSIFIMDWMNEIEREDPIFIENEGVSVAKGYTLSAACVPSPIRHGFGSNRGPRPYPIPLELAHGLVPSPNGPWPHGRTPMAHHRPRPGPSDRNPKSPSS